MRRLILPLVGVVALVLGFAALLPGEVTIELRDYTLRGQGVFFALALLLSFLLFYGLLRALEQLYAWPARRRQRAARRQQARGLDAVVEAIEALLSRDGRRAESAAARVGALLDKPRLHRILAAQAAALRGDSVAAEHQLEQLHHQEPKNTFATAALIRAAHTQAHPQRALHLAETSYKDNKRDGANIALYAAELVRQQNTAALARLCGSWAFRWHLVPEQRRRVQGQLAFLQGRFDDVLALAAPDTALFVLALQKQCAAKPDKAAALLLSNWQKNPVPVLTALLWEQLRLLSADERRKKVAGLVKKHPDQPEARRLEYLNAVQDGAMDTADSLRRHHVGADTFTAAGYSCGSCGAPSPEPLLVCPACFAVDSLSTVKSAPPPTAVALY